jgi:hypothetical protein
MSRNLCLHLFASCRSYASASAASICHCGLRTYLISEVVWLIIGKRIDVPSSFQSDLFCDKGLVSVNCLFFFKSYKSKQNLLGIICMSRCMEELKNLQSSNTLINQG